MQFCKNILLGKLNYKDIQDELPIRDPFVIVCKPLMTIDINLSKDIKVPFWSSQTDLLLLVQREHDDGKALHLLYYLKLRRSTIFELPTHLYTGKNVNIT